MDISARKLSLIKWLSNVNDEKLLQKVEALASDTIQKDYRHYVQPRTDEELKNLVNESEENYKAGRVHTHEEVKRRFKSGK